MIKPKPPPNAPPLPEDAIMDLTAQVTIERLLERKRKALEKLHKEVAGLKNLLKATESEANRRQRDLFFTDTE